MTQEAEWFEREIRAAIRETPHSPAVCRAMACFNRSLANRTGNVEMRKIALKMAADWDAAAEKTETKL